jgi:hypothetical protein
METMALNFNFIEKNGIVKNQYFDKIRYDADFESFLKLLSLFNVIGNVLFSIRKRLVCLFQQYFLGQKCNKWVPTSRTYNSSFHRNSFIAASNK